MAANRYSHQDNTGLVVTGAMALLALLGLATVFHEVIAGVFFPPAPGESSREPPR